MMSITHPPKMPFFKRKRLFSSFVFVFLLISATVYGFISITGTNEPAGNLDQIKKITRAVYLIQQNYYDPKRIHPEKMLREGLNALSKKISEMLVEFPEHGNQITLSLGSQKTQIPLQPANKIFDILKPTADAFAFLQKNYKGDVKADDQEYAFINGLLETLDPHSNLLTPDVFKEFQTQTEGIYGGIGIVVGIKDDELTVISPLEGTPAMRAGLKTDDKISQIDDLPTINMSLSEAVERLRGKVNSKVTLQIQRKNRDPLEVTLIREKITIESVWGKLLNFEQKKIAFLRVRSFQEDTFADLEKEIEKIKALGSIDGIVLDLRNNPGGLLDQSLFMADKFLAEGDLLFTVGPNNNDEEVTRAQRGNDILSAPMVVLVNQGSASASEIVAGALKRNDRAVVMGMQTFGKGSVQSLFNLRDGSALKLTVAQYLTPKRISIQAVGITPDIMLVPTLVSDETFDLMEDEHFGEKSLDEHLENPEYALQTKPSFSFHFFDQEKKPEEEENEYTLKVDEKKDYVLALALKILTRTKEINREKMLKAGEELLKKEAKEQELLISQALKQKGIDFTAGTKTEAPSLLISSQFLNKKTGQPVLQINAGDEIDWVLSAKNEGVNDAARLLATVKSENQLIDEREFVFGRIKPGEVKSAKTTLKIPEEIISFEEDARVEFETDSKGVIPPLTVATRFIEKPKPAFAYQFQLQDGASAGSMGNGNGIPEKGETITVNVKLKNTSPNPAEEVAVNLKNAEKGGGVRLTQGRAPIGILAPQAEGNARLIFQIPNDFAGNEVKLELSVFDKSTRAGFSDTLKFSIIAAQSPSAEPPPNTLLSPPQIAISRTETGANKRFFELSGAAEDNLAIKDLIVYAGGKKIFYQANPPEKLEAKMPFNIRIPLEEGANYIAIEARDDRDFSSQKILSVMGAPKKALASQSPATQNALP